MAKRLAELGALQDAVSNDESSPKRLALAGYIRGLFLDWSANPYNPLSRLTARGRLLGYFWDSGAIGLSMNFADQNYLVKDGTVQSKSFSQIVNFSRTTNATVTNSAGQITYAPHNLLTYSEQFDNAAWVKSNVTVTSNTTTAPNGTITADTITSAATNGFIYQTFSAIAGTTYTFSCYVKSVSTATTLQIALLNASGASGIASVEFTTTGTWTRVSVTGISATTQTAWVAFGTGGSFNTGETIYVWGSQLEVGARPTSYNPTTVKNLLGYTEAFDNAAWTKSNSFVQTNLLTYSEAFDNAAWAKTTITATANSIVAPNGYQTADTLTASGANSTALQTFTASAVPYTFSVYLYRKIGTGNIDITVDGATWVTKTITAGWTRVDTTLTPSAGSKTAGIRIVTSGDEVYAWGAQLVQGSVAGDYRRTDAAALPVYYPNHNGVVCAEKLVEDTATGFHYTRPATSPAVVAGTLITTSIYAKAAERNRIYVFPYNSSAGAIFNLSTGVVVSSDTGVTASIQSVDNGWYRCSATIAAPATSPAPWFLVYNGATNYAGDGTSGIYIFGAQLSDSASLDPYVLNAAAAPTAAAYYGARFDYDPVTLAPKGLLIEEQRANLLLNSTLPATNLATQSVTVTAVAHTLSFYGTGTVTITGTYIGSLVGSGAYPTRSTLTFTPTAGTLTLTVTGTVQYAQLEIGAFATSFIPTAASQVTRAADVATIQGSNFYSWWNQNEGSFTVSPTNIATTGNRIPWEVNDNTANNRVRVFINTTTSTWTLQAASSGVAGPAITPSVALQTVKIASGLKSFDFAQVVNTALVSNTTALIPVISTQLQIGIGQTGAASQFNGTIKQISYYPQKLSSDVLKGLTA